MESSMPSENPDEFDSVEELTQWYNDVLAAQFAISRSSIGGCTIGGSEVKASKRRKRMTAATGAAEVQRPAALNGCAITLAGQGSE